MLRGINSPEKPGSLLIASLAYTTENPSLTPSIRPDSVSE